MSALLTNVERDMRKLFTADWSVLQVRRRYPDLPWASVAEAYFAVVVERSVQYTAQLADALDDAAKARGMSRAVIARRALETLAAFDLIGPAVDGSLQAQLALPLEDRPLPRFLPHHEVHS